ncbi:enoyl-CoA hydratase/isomerase family protein [Mangrovitalea sediminis]|uniref:enoyl-CoA hydratase/isomerase family protein n=1 Tax=Mangrovitalea sediminis TaxID=1982043 RepID=UPI000BE5F4B2|nr:enoyl-CoA hydratase-related protein [Mangrovitalea sediminis]
MTDYTTLLVATDGPVLTITLNRPDARNAMSLAMVEELQSVFDDAAANDAVRMIVLRGSQGTFCAGGDIKDMAGARSQPPGEHGDPFFALNRAFGRLIQQVERCPKVVVAALEGAVLGGGFGLACVSDIAIARDNCLFGLPETSLGVIPAQIAPFVVQRIGLTQARRIALMGLRFDGEEAFRLGVVHEVVHNEEALNQALQAVLTQIQRCAPNANSATKDLLLRVGHEPMDALLDDAARAFAEAVRGPEGTEGTMAFVQKRKPKWAE